MYRGRQKTFPRNDFLQDIRNIPPVCSNGKSRSVRPFRTHARPVLPIGHPCRGHTLFRSQIRVGKRPDLHYDTCTLVHAAAILFLEKLYAVYYHSSGYLLDKLKYTTQSLEHFDFILFDMCSTRNTKIFSTLATQERTERTEYIIDDTLTKKYLHVCIKTIDDGPVHNCGRCYKCLRTLAAIDILGKLPEYETIFDQSYYKTHKAAIFAKYLGYRAADPFFADILNFAKQKGFRIPKMAYLLSVKYYLLLPAYMLGRELPNPTKKKIKKFLRMKG